VFHGIASPPAFAPSSASISCIDDPSTVCSEHQPQSQNIGARSRWNSPTAKPDSRGSGPAIQSGTSPEQIGPMTPPTARLACPSRDWPRIAERSYRSVRHAGRCCMVATAFADSSVVDCGRARRRPISGPSRAERVSQTARPAAFPLAVANSISPGARASPTAITVIPAARNGSARASSGTRGVA
jgi:hypothetical protein